MNKTLKFKHTKDGKVREKMSPYIIITLIMIVTTITINLVLLTWGIFTSLKTQNYFRTHVFGLPQGAPWDWAWENYTKVLDRFYVTVGAVNGTRKVWLPELAYNTVIYAVSGTIANTGCAFFCAYATAKYKYKFNTIMVGTVIITMILPLIGSGAASMKLFMALGLYDTLMFKFVANFNFLGMDFLLFRGLFQGISDDYLNAARLDGASEWRIIFQIVMPLASGLLIIQLFSGVLGLYNDWQTPLLYMPNHPTLAYGVYTITTSKEGEFTTVPVRIASSVMIGIPSAILFILLRKKMFITINIGGLKE